MQPKPMRTFFIDNQGMWPTYAMLAGDLVFWKDTGKYPNYVPIAIASHPDYNGRIVLMAGTRGIVIAFCPEAMDAEGVRRCLSGGMDEKYRIAVDAIIHRMMIWRAAGEGRGDANPLALLNWLRASSPADAEVLAKGLRLLLKDPKTKEDWEKADEMLTSLDKKEEVG